MGQRKRRGYNKQSVIYKFIVPCGERLYFLTKIFLIGIMVTMWIFLGHQRIIVFYWSQV